MLFLLALSVVLNLTATFPPWEMWRENEGNSKKFCAIFFFNVKFVLNVKKNELLLSLQNTQKNLSFFLDEQRKFSLTNIKKRL